MTPTSPPAFPPDLIGLRSFSLGYFIPGPPTLVDSPRGQVVSPGADVTLTVSATGSPPLLFQWYYNAFGIAGATNSSLSLRNVSQAHVGEYYVVVRNDYGSIASQSVAVRLAALPIISQQPVSRDARLGETITFEVVATGTPPLAYQWWFQAQGSAEARAVPAGINAVLTLANVQADQAGEYHVVVTNPAGLVTSSSALLILPAVFRFGAGQYEVTESGGSLSVPVRRQGWTTNSVGYEVMGGTAVAGRDYRLEPGRLEFIEGETNRAIEITLLNDYVLDGDRGLGLRLTDPSPGSAIGEPAEAQILIRDDEPPLTPTLYARVTAPEALGPSGQIRVYIEADDDVSTGWRLPWELFWRREPAEAKNLPVGTYSVEFRPVGGYRAPPPESIPVQAGRTSVRTVRYVRDASVASGSLVVRLQPLEVRGLGGWRLRGDAVYLTNGARLTDLPAGTNNLHILELQEVDQWLTPLPRTVQILAGLETEVTAQYEPRSEVPVGVRTPEAVPTFAEVEDGLSEALPRPLSLMGQLRSAAGYGSGIAVGRKVVLTSAHMVFMDGSTNPVSVVEWFHERQAGEYDPAGVYLGTFDGRSLVRAIDGEVANLINRAASSADLGTNFAGGGAIVFTGGGATDPSAPGRGLFALQKLTVRLEPAAAVASGAAWRVTNFPTMAFTNVAECSTELTAGLVHVLVFKPLAGYQTPTNFPVTLPAGQDATLTVKYEPIEAPLIGGTPSEGIFVSGPAGATVVIEYRDALGPSVGWSELLTLTLGDQPARIVGPPWPTEAPGFYRARRDN